MKIGGPHYNYNDNNTEEWHQWNPSILQSGQSESTQLFQELDYLKTIDNKTAVCTIINRTLSFDGVNAIGNVYSDSSLHEQALSFPNLTNILFIQIHKSLLCLVQIFFNIRTRFWEWKNNNKKHTLLPLFYGPIFIYTYIYVYTLVFVLHVIALSIERTWLKFYCCLYSV